MRNVSAAWDVDHHQISHPFVQIILFEPLAKRGGLHPHDTVMAGIVIVAPSEDATAKQILLEPIAAAFQSLPHYELEQRRKLVGLSEVTAGQQPAKLLLHLCLGGTCCNAF